MTIIGIDIGGTKIATTKAQDDGTLLASMRFPTADWATATAQMLDGIAALEPGPEPVFGIASGGPLDARSGRILGPPNLPE